MMKRLSVLFAVAAVLLLGTAATQAQTPSLDLAIDGSATWDGMYLDVHVQVTVDAHDPFAQALSTNGRLYLDGRLVAEYPFDLTWPETGTCPDHVAPDCGGTCNALYVNGQPVDAYTCNYLPGQQDPPYVDFCFCMYLIFDDTEQTTYQGENIARLVIDEDDTIPEIDETNNEVILDLAPVAQRAWTWTQVKGQYR